jgi:hypothetical protein
LLGRFRKVGNNRELLLPGILDLTAQVRTFQERLVFCVALRMLEDLSPLILLHLPLSKMATSPSPQKERKKKGSKTVSMGIM